jgi:hypothetical protein
VLHPSESRLQRSFCPAVALPLGLKHRLDGGLADTSGPVNREPGKRQPASFMGLVVRPGQ